MEMTFVKNIESVISVVVELVQNIVEQHKHPDTALKMNNVLLGIIVENLTMVPHSNPATIQSTVFLLQNQQEALQH